MKKIGLFLSVLYISSTFAQKETYLLHKAVRKGQIEKVITILDSAEDPKSLVNTEYGGQMPLHIAVEEGYVEMVPLLLKYGAKIEAVDEQGRTPLILASSGYDERFEITKILLENGAKIEAIDNEKKTALIHASKEGHTNTVNILLDHNANIEAIDDKKKRPLMYASEEGHTNTVNTLLERGAKIEAIDDEERTALILASKRHSTKNIISTINTLLDHGAKIEATDKDGRTPLMLASLGSHVDTANTLLDRGAKIEAIDKHGRTPLILVSNNIWYRWDDPILILVTLLNRNANIEAVDEQGRTALRLAIKRGYPLLANRLLDHGAKIETANIKKEFEETALALVNNHLLKNKVDFQNNIDRLKNENADIHLLNNERYLYKTQKRRLITLRKRLERHERNQKGSFISRCRLMFSSSSTPSFSH